MTRPRAIVRLRRIAALAAAVSIPLGCDRSPESAQSSSRQAPAPPTQEVRRPLRVAVTIPPLAGLVKPLLRENDELTILLSPGKSEHGFEFTPKELAALGRSDVILYVGLGLEPQVERFLSRGTKSVRQNVSLAALLNLSPPPAADDASHDHSHVHAPDKHASHEPEHQHAVDPHLWLDPQLVRDAVPGIRAAVERSLPSAGIAPGADARRLDAAEAKLLADIAQIDLEYRTRLKPFEGHAIVTHHAAFGRLGARYGLRIAEVIRPVESAEPTPGQLSEVVAAIKKQNVQVIFVEPQFNADAARRIADAAGVRVGTLDPLGDGDWLAMMRRNLDELVAKLSGK